MLKIDQVVAERPHCFGKEYDSTASECVGGHDPAYSDPDKPGSRVRPRCDFVSTCAVHMQANRQINRQEQRYPNGFVPATNLTRPSTQFNPPVAQRPPWSPPGQQGPMVQQPHWQGNGQPRYYMEQYLTVRQPVNSGQSLGGRLFWESVRSMGKSLGHTISHFFDVEIFGNGRQGPGDQ